VYDEFIFPSTEQLSMKDLDQREFHSSDF